jgi:hypothetical protein
VVGAGGAEALTRLAFNHRRPHALSIASVTSHNASHVSDLPPKTPTSRFATFASLYHTTLLLCSPPSTPRPQAPPARHSRRHPRSACATPLAVHRRGGACRPGTAARAPAAPRSRATLHHRVAVQHRRRNTAMREMRIVTLGITGGRSLTGPLRDARRFLSTRL